MKKSEKLQDMGYLRSYFLCRILYLLSKAVICLPRYKLLNPIVKITSTFLYCLNSLMSMLQLFFNEICFP